MIRIALISVLLLSCLKSQANDLIEALDTHIAIQDSIIKILEVQSENKDKVIEHQRTVIELEREKITMYQHNNKALQGGIILERQKAKQEKRGVGLISGASGVALGILIGIIVIK